MPLLNFTTKVPAAKTVTEISTILQKSKVMAFLTELDSKGEVSAISFRA